MRKRWHHRIALCTAGAALAVAACGAAPAYAADTFTVDVPGWYTVGAGFLLPYSNAEILQLTCNDGLGDTVSCAVVDQHQLVFYADQAGEYTIARAGAAARTLSREGCDVWSSIHDLSGTYSLTGRTDMPVLNPSFDATTHLLKTGGYFLPYDPFLTNAKSVSSSSENHPVRALMHFVASGAYPEGSVEMSSSTADALLGFTDGSTNAYAYAASGTGETDFDPSYLVVEDRDEDTGKLIAQVSFVPTSTARPAASGEGGGQSFNLEINPTYQMLYDSFAAHSAISSDATKAKTAADQVFSVESLDKCVVLANLDTKCAYSTGAKSYKLDIATLSGGKLGAGDEVELKFLGMANDATPYGNKKVNATFEKLLEATDETYTVDADGYVTFDLYGGGVYALGVQDTVSSISLTLPDTSYKEGGGGSSTDPDDPDTPSSGDDPVTPSPDTPDTGGGSDTPSSDSPSSGDVSDVDTYTDTTSVTSVDDSGSDLVDVVSTSSDLADVDLVEGSSGNVASKSVNVSNTSITNSSSNGGSGTSQAGDGSNDATGEGATSGDQAGVSTALIAAAIALVAVVAAAVALFLARRSKKNGGSVAPDGVSEDGVAGDAANPAASVASAVAGVGVASGVAAAASAGAPTDSSVVDDRPWEKARPRTESVEQRVRRGAGISFSSDSVFVDDGASAAAALGRGQKGR